MRAPLKLNKFSLSILLSINLWTNLESRFGEAHLLCLGGAGVPGPVGELVAQELPVQGVHRRGSPLQVH